MIVCTVNLSELNQLFVFDDHKATYRKVLAKIMELENENDWVEHDVKPLTLNDLISFTEKVHSQQTPHQITDDNNQHI